MLLQLLPGSSAQFELGLASMYQYTNDQNPCWNGFWMEQMSRSFCGAVNLFSSFISLVCSEYHLWKNKSLWKKTLSKFVFCIFSWFLSIFGKNAKPIQLLYLFKNVFISKGTHQEIQKKYTLYLVLLYFAHLWKWHTFVNDSALTCMEKCALSKSLFMWIKQMTDSWFVCTVYTHWLQLSLSLLMFWSVFVTCVPVHAQLSLTVLDKLSRLVWCDGKPTVSDILHSFGFLNIDRRCREEDKDEDKIWYEDVKSLSLIFLCDKYLSLTYVSVWMDTSVWTIMDRFMITC